MDFNIIWHSCSPSWVAVQFSTFIQKNPRSHLKVKFQNWCNFRLVTYMPKPVPLECFIQKRPSRRGFFFFYRNNLFSIISKFIYIKKYTNQQLWIVLNLKYEECIAEWFMTVKTDFTFHMNKEFLRWRNICGLLVFRNDTGYGLEKEGSTQSQTTKIWPCPNWKHLQTTK